MKTKLTPGNRQKIRPAVKVLLGATTVAVCALMLAKVLHTAAVPPAEASSFNSGRCLSFNGVNSGVTFENNNLNLSEGNTITVTAWVQWGNTTTAGEWANLVTLNDGKGPSGDEGQFWLQHSQTNTNFEFAVENTSSTRNFIQSVTTPVVGTWYHVAGVYDGSYINIYVNGLLEARTAMTGTINNYQGNFALNFGQWANSANSYRHFNGCIDEVTIWNTALTQAQIRTNMCQKLNGNESGLVGYWRMNESSGSVVTDKTSNGRNGTSLNTAIVFSGAPIGDASSCTFGGGSLSLKDKNFSDSIYVNGFSSAPAGIFIYRIDTVPNTSLSVTGYPDISKVNYWGVFIVNPKGETYKTTYCYQGFPGVTDPASLGLLTRNDNAILSWADLLATDNTAKNTLSKPLQTGRNEYILASKSKSNPLPVELLSFDVLADGNQEKIDWVTATETNNASFTVERTRDQLNYETIAQVKGSGTSSVRNNYTAVDLHPLTGTSYYRLKQTDYDGKFVYFGPVAVRYAEAAPNNNFGLNKVYPNPFKDQFTIELDCKSETLLTMQLVGFDGKIARKQSIECPQGISTFSYTDFSNLAEGNYIVQLSDGNGHTVSAKLIKTK